MCLAIYAPAGSDIPEKNLKNGFDNNSDGAGMAWATDGQLHVRKGMFKFEEVIDQYNAIKQYPCMIHFRKATSGKIDMANCHPFLFNDGKLALIHNGVLAIKCNIDGLSDTAHFVKLVLEPLIKNYSIPINDGSLHYLITTSIGSDKMCIMEGTGKTYILNEDKGIWDEKVWYSNTSFRWTYTKPDFTSVNTNYMSISKNTNRGYFSSNTTNKSPLLANSSNNNSTNWRKHWEDDESGDADYINFWKKNNSNSNSNSNLLSLSNPVDTNDAQLIGPQTHRFTNLLEAPKSDGVDESGNVILVVEEVASSKYSEGQMCEYGWFDPEIESDIAVYQQNIGLSREEAMIRVFNEK